MSYVPFVPLRVFSAYTMLEGAIEPKAIGEAAKKLGFPAIAICDRNGLYGVMPFQDGAKSKGVQPIIGALLGVRRPTSDGKFIRDWLPLFVQDESGYNNLCRLVSMAHLDRPEDLDAHVTLEQLAPFSDGLIALTGGAEGAVTQLLSDGQTNSRTCTCNNNVKSLKICTHLLSAFRVSNERRFNFANSFDAGA